MPSVSSKVKSWLHRTRSKKLKDASTSADQATVTNMQHEPAPYVPYVVPGCRVYAEQGATAQSVFHEQVAARTNDWVQFHQNELYERGFEKPLGEPLTLRDSTSGLVVQRVESRDRVGSQDGHNANALVHTFAGANGQLGNVASKDDQAEGERRQYSKDSKDSPPATPQGVGQADVSDDVTMSGVSESQTQAQGSDLLDTPSPSSHIAATPQALNPGIDPKGKAPEDANAGAFVGASAPGPLPRMQVEGTGSGASVGRYNQILSAVGVPCSRPAAQGAQRSEERAPARVAIDAERAAAPRSRVAEILSAVGIPRVGVLGGGQRQEPELVEGVRYPDEDLEGSALRLLFREGYAEGETEETGGASPPHLAAAMADDPPAVPLFAHRQCAHPALLPNIQSLFDKQDALRAHILLLEPEPAHQPLMTRLETIRTLLLESGSALGNRELESLEGEVAAMDLVLILEQEERDMEIDRMLSANLQQEFDEEYAAQLERGGLGLRDSADLDELVDCCICLEEVPKRDCVAACIPPGHMAVGEDESSGGEDDASDAPPSSLFPTTCSHWHCIECLRQYATVKVSEDRTARIPCTAPGGCPGLFPFENVEWLLGEKETQMYLQLLAEESIVTKVYCPFDGCIAVMDCAADERGPDSLCALCKRLFCRSCRVEWHAGKTCVQYQSAKEDEPLHALAKQQNWKPCPKCQNMIERKDGCNYMRCKCGAGFCYKCGAGYTSNAATGGNVHGTAGCKCRLF